MKRREIGVGSFAAAGGKLSRGKRVMTAGKREKREKKKTK